MTASKQPDFAELNALAIEACDMWQEHLSSLANDPKARAELTKFLEPQRRLFADWTSMMQKGATPNSATKPQPKSEWGAGGRDDDSQHAQSAKPTAGTTTKTAEAKSEKTSGGHEHGDDSLRVAQLALRVAELEKRLVQLESRFSAKPAGAARATQRTAS